MSTRTLKTLIVTQGTTASPSTVRAQILDGALRVTNQPFLRVRVCDSAGYAVATNATIAAANGCTSVEVHSANKDLTLKQSTQATATGTLTIAGVVVDTQTVTIGTRVYEFDTHTTSRVTSGRVRVNISASATKAVGTLTLATQPTATDTMTVGARTYVWVANGTADADGEISVGADLAAAKVNVIAAINGTDGFNVANTTVSAGVFATNALPLTALAGGVIGNSIVTTETYTAGGNVFDAATLGTTTAGVDCTLGNAATALRTAINADTSAVVVATGTSGTVTLTAKSSGSTANSFPTTETMANGSFGAVTLTGGADGGNGVFDFTVTNATAETVTLRFGPPLLGPVEPTDHSVTRNVTHAA